MRNAFGARADDPFSIFTGCDYVGDLFVTLSPPLLRAVRFSLSAFLARWKVFAIICRRLDIALEIISRPPCLFHLIWPIFRQFCRLWLGLCLFARCFPLPILSDICVFLVYY